MKCAKLFALVFLVFEGVAALPAPPQGLLRPEDSEPRLRPRKAAGEHQQSSAEAAFARGLRDPSPDLASSAWVIRSAQEDDGSEIDFANKQRFLVRRLIQSDESPSNRWQRNPKKVVIGTLLGLGALGTGGYFAITKLLNKEKADDSKQQQQSLPGGPSYSPGGAGCSPTGVGCRRDVADDKRQESIPSDDQSEGRLTARTADDGIDVDFPKQRFLVTRLLQARSDEDEREDSNLDRRQHSRKNLLFGGLLGLGALGGGGYFAISSWLKHKKEQERKKQEQQQQSFPEDPAYSGGGCRRDVSDKEMHKMMSQDDESDDRLTARTARSWTPGRKTLAAGGLLTLGGLGLASYLGWKALHAKDDGDNQPPPQFGQPRRRSYLGEDGDEEKRDAAYLAVRC